MTLIVLCPSYKRPRQAKELLESFKSTITGNSHLTFGVWEDDPTLSEYPRGSQLPQQAMVPRTNALCAATIASAEYIGWVADDMRFLTPGWDEMVIKSLEDMGGGIVYGNDMVDPGSKPSHAFMSVEIPKTLGWLHHPGLTSTFGDDVWQYLGQLMGRLKYLPDVKIQHLYHEKDNEKDFLHDLEVFQRWVAEEADRDADKCLRALRRRRRSRPSSGTSTEPSSTQTVGIPTA